MRAALLAVTMFALGAPSLQAFAQEEAVRQQTLELSQRLVDIGSSEGEFVDAAILGFRNRMAVENIQLSDTQWARLLPQLQEIFEHGGAALTATLVSEYAANATAEDLAAAIAYYTSESGQRFSEAVKAWTLGATMTLALGGEFSAANEHEPSAAANTLAQAMSERLSPLEQEQLAVASIDLDQFQRALAHYMGSRLSEADLQAAEQWARSPASIRLEGPSAWRVQANQLATIRAFRAIDYEAINSALLGVLGEPPT